MTPTDWHAPLKCPMCQAEAARPYSVVSKTATEVMVNVRCAKCGHQWQLERETPNLAPKFDRMYQRNEDDSAS